MRDQNGALLLRVCGACLHEVSSLRREVREALERLGSGQGGAETPPPPPLQVISDPQLRRHEELLSTCSVDDSSLRELLVSLFETGQLAVSRRELADRAQGAAGGPAQFFTALLTEIQRGSIRALVLVDGEVKTDLQTVEDCLSREGGERRNASEGDLLADSGPRVVVWPLFRRATSALAEVLIQRCREERLLTPLELLLEAMRALVFNPDSKGMVEESSLLVAVNDALVQSGPPGLRLTLELAPSSRVVVAEAPCWREGAKEGSRPFPLHPEAGAEQLGPGDAAALARAAEELRPRMGLVSAVCGFATTLAGSGGDGEPQRAPAGPGVLVGLLSVLRRLSHAPGVDLPEALARPGAGGAVLWAFERAAAGQAERPGDLAHAHPALSGAAPASGAQLCSATRPESEAASTQPSKNLAVRVVAPASHKTEEGGHPNEHLTGSAPDGPDGLEVWSSWNSEQETTKSHGDGEESNEGQDLKSETQVHFVECFKEDLMQNRHLLMSQINNLYRMRNGGSTLQYKLAGYDKLHDFLLDIPGLEPQGTGNKMEIKIVDMLRFDAFCVAITEGRDMPRFHRPQPLPESFQRHVIEVFRRAGSREIPAKSFRDLWNCFFPADKLHCKDFGYRDVKGLLANVPLIDKVGSKASTRYVLKDDVDLVERAERGALPQGAILPISPDGSEGGGQQQFVGSGRPLPAGGVVDPRWSGGSQAVWTPLSPMTHQQAPQVPQQQMPLGSHTQYAMQRVSHQEAPAPMPAHARFGSQYVGHQEEAVADAGGAGGGAWGPAQPGGLLTSLTQVSLPNPRMRQMIPAPGMATSVAEGVNGLGTRMDASGSPASQNFMYGPAEVAQHAPAYLRVGRQQPQQPQPPPQPPQRQPQQSVPRPISPQRVGLRAEAGAWDPSPQSLNAGYPLGMSREHLAPGAPTPSSMHGDLQPRLSHPGPCLGAGPPGGGLQRQQPQQQQQQQQPEQQQQWQQTQQPMLPAPLRSSDVTEHFRWATAGSLPEFQEAEPDLFPGMPWLPRPRDTPPPEPPGPPAHAPGAGQDLGSSSGMQSPTGVSVSLPTDAFGNAFGTEPLSPKSLLSHPLAIGSSLPPVMQCPLVGPLGMPQLWGEGPRVPQSPPDDAPAVVPVSSPGPPPGLVPGESGVPPTVPETEPAEDLPQPAVPETVPETGPLQTEESSADFVAPLTAAEHRKLRRQGKKNTNTKQATSFFSSPGAISSEDRDASKCQGKFDMSSLYQAQLQTDRPCLIADFSNGLVVMSNSLCDRLFENLCPLQRRDVVDLIHEDDRLNFSACIMYLSIGKFLVMGPQRMRMLTAKGEQTVIVNGEQMVGSWWWLDIRMMDEATEDMGASAGSAAVAAVAGAAGGDGPALTAATAPALEPGENSGARTDIAPPGLNGPGLGSSAGLNGPGLGSSAGLNGPGLGSSAGLGSNSGCAGASGSPSGLGSSSGLPSRRQRVDGNEYFWL